MEIKLITLGAFIVFILLFVISIAFNFSDNEEKEYNYVIKKHTNRIKDTVTYTIEREYYSMGVGYQYIVIAEYDDLQEAHRVLSSLGNKDVLEEEIMYRTKFKI